MVNLDSLLAHRKYDPSGMLTRIQAYPGDLRAGWNTAAELSLPDDFRRARNVVILGMGGSAVGGETVAGLVMADSRVSVTIQREFNAPTFIGEDTLVIAVSHSGNTEETLSAFDEALRTRAHKLVMTSGGMLRGIAKRHNLPLLLMDVPGPPRTTFPFQFAALTGIFSRLGMLPVQSAEIETTADFLSRRVQSWDVSMPVDSNHAKLLAIKLRGKIPVIYGAGLLSPVARRWKTQFNENSKTWAFAESFPELVHNASVGFDFPIISLRRVFVCMLRSSSMHRRALVQYKAITNLLDERSFPHEIIDAKGETAIEQVLETALLGDFTSYYLAILNRTDPTSNPAIDFVKKYMADTRG